MQVTLTSKQWERLGRFLVAKFRETGKLPELSIIGASAKRGGAGVGQVTADTLKTAVQFQFSRSLISKHEFDALLEKVARVRLW